MNGRDNLPARDLVVIPAGDADAVEIGQCYRAARTSLVDSMRYAIECGQRLIAKKESLAHGAWLPWLHDNADALGFEADRTARRFMALAANRTLASDLNESAAVTVSRQLWGHQDSQLVQQSLSSEHYTPQLYIEAARKVLGGIDLDPASCTEANRIVRARTFYSADDDGLGRDWGGTVWLNPPYGRAVGDFVGKFFTEYAAQRLSAGIVLVNAHCTDTDWFRPLWDGLLCFTDHRINFYGDETRSGSTHGSVFVYFGGRRRAFANAFEQFGPIVARHTP